MELPPQTPLHRMRGGKAFLTILAVVAFGAVAFFALVGYYLWQIDAGQGEKLAQEFENERFTRASASAAAPKDLEDDGASLIRQHTPTKGDADAEVTILAFIDFECPFCREGYPIFRAVMETYAPVARVAFKHFPIDGLHPNATPAANAAACAAEQNKFWEYYDILFQTQSLEESDLLAYAEALNLNLPGFTDCFHTRKYQYAIDADLEDVVAAKVRGTPTYFVNGKRVEGVIDLDAWDAIILDALQKAN